jgi:alpha-mannosidase
MIGLAGFLAAAAPAAAQSRAPRTAVDPWSGDGVPTLPVTRSPVYSTMDISPLLREPWPTTALGYARAIHRLAANLPAREGVTLNVASPALLHSAGLHDPTMPPALRRLAEADRLAIDGASQWVAPDARLIHGESLIRQHLYAFRYWVDEWQAWPENAALGRPVPRPTAAGAGLTFRVAPVERLFESPDGPADVARAARLTNRADIKTLHRHAESALLSAEAIGTLASLSGMTYPTGDMDEAFRTLLFCQQHDTLGGVCLPGNYEYTAMLLRGVQDRAAWGQTAALRHLAARAAHPGGDFAVLVANPLGFRRSTWVAVDAETGSNRQSRYTVTRSDGREVNWQIVRTRDGDQLQIAAEDVPAYGYDTYRVTRLEPATKFTPHDPPQDADQVTARVDAEGIRIENSLVRVLLDKQTGQIISFLDKRTNREMLAGGRSGNVLELHFESPADATADEFGTIARVETLDTREDTTVTDQGPYVGRVRVTRRRGDSIIEQQLSLHAGSPRLDVETHYLWRESAPDHEPAPIVRVAFPAAEGEGLKGRFGTAYGEAVLGADGAERAGLSYAALTGSTGGLALLTRDRHGFSASADGTLRLTLLRTLFQPPAPSQFVASRLDYAVVPISATAEAVELAAMASDYTMPLAGQRMEASGSDAARRLPGRFEALDTSTLAAGARVVCFKRAHDGEGYIVRAVAPAAMTSGGAIRPGFPVKHAEISSCLEWWKRDELAFSGGAAGDPADAMGRNIFDGNQGLIPLVMKNSRILTVRVLPGEAEARAAEAEPARPDAD